MCTCMCSIIIIIVTIVLLHLCIILTNDRAPVRPYVYIYIIQKYNIYMKTTTTIYHHYHHKRQTPHSASCHACPNVLVHTSKWASCNWCSSWPIATCPFTGVHKHIWACKLQLATKNTNCNLPIYWCAQAHLGVHGNLHCVVFVICG